MSTFDLDLGDLDCIASEHVKEQLSLSIAADLFLSNVKRLTAPTPSEQGIADVLDFFAPWGPGRACFYAVHALRSGRLTIDIDEDYDVIAARVRKQCRELMASGRVKAAGQPRNRTPKPADEAQGDLFGEE